MKCKYVAGTAVESAHGCYEGYLGLWDHGSIFKVLIMLGMAERGT
jgi:hypothetical protein